MVKRFEPSSAYCISDSAMEEHPEGEYVLYEDYLALWYRVSTMHADMEDALETLNDISDISRKMSNGPP